MNAHTHAYPHTQTSLQIGGQTQQWKRQTAHGKGGKARKPYTALTGLHGTTQDYTGVTQDYMGLHMITR